MARSAAVCFLPVVVGLLERDLPNFAGSRDAASHPHPTLGPRGLVAAEMNPVNATSLYVSASRSVLQCDPRDPRALAELCKLLPFFRQSLSCLVCGESAAPSAAPRPQRNRPQQGFNS